MKRDDEKTQDQSKSNERPTQNITAYIGLQNEPLGDEPNISISFAISLRLFCVFFAISRLEIKEKEQRDNKRKEERSKEPKEEE
jgi:hypothetical protein